tara:strand:- start:760 stop:1302 length:543 start_codon:yes stop_codon:yes gene_type:complete
MNFSDTKNLRWFLIYTKPRQEKRAKENLNNQGIQVLLPLYLHIGLKKLESVKPIFPRYLFVQIDLDKVNWASIKSTKGVSNLVFFGEKPAFVDKTLVKEIEAKLDSQSVYRGNISTRVLKKGDKVQINKGPMKGVEAIFLSKNSKNRVKILIEILRTSTIASISETSISSSNEIKEFKLK